MIKTYCANDDASTKSYEELKANLARLEAQITGEDLAAADRAERRLAIETCHEVKENGRLCRSAAVSGRHYCYFHLRHRARRLVMARARARGQHWRLQLPPLEDLPSVQVALMQVLDAVTDDSIDPRRAGLLLYGLQQAATILRARAEDWEESNRFESDEELEYAHFEAEFDLPPDLDLATPPEVAFPPPQETDAEAEADDFDATPLDVELMDSNAQSGAQRVKQASNAEVKRQQQRLAHAHRTALAEARQAERKAERIEAARARWAAEAAAREQAAGDGASPHPNLKKAPQAAVPEGDVEVVEKSHKSK